MTKPPGWVKVMWQDGRQVNPTAAGPSVSYFIGERFERHTYRYHCDTGSQLKEIRMLLKETLILSVQGVLQRIPSYGIGLPQIVVPVKLASSGGTSTCE